MFEPGSPLLLMLAEIRAKFRQDERISVLENEYITEKLADLTWRYGQRRAPCQIFKNVR